MAPGPPPLLAILRPDSPLVPLDDRSARDEPDQYRFPRWPRPPRTSRTLRRIRAPVGRPVSARPEFQISTRSDVRLRLSSPAADRLPGPWPAHRSAPLPEKGLLDFDPPAFGVNRQAFSNRFQRHLLELLALEGAGAGPAAVSSLLWCAGSTAMGWISGAPLLPRAAGSRPARLFGVFRARSPVLNSNIAAGHAREPFHTRLEPAQTFPLRRASRPSPRPQQPAISSSRPLAEAPESCTVLAMKSVRAQSSPPTGKVASMSHSAARHGPAARPAALPAARAWPSHAASAAFVTGFDYGRADEPPRPPPPAPAGRLPADAGPASSPPAARLAPIQARSSK